MAVTAFFFGAHFVGQYSQTTARRVNWVDDSIKCLLTSNTDPSTNQDTYDFRNDVTGVELAASGNYSTGGAAIPTSGTRSVSYDNASNETRLIAGGNTVWSSATFSAYYGIVYVETAGADTTDPLISWVNFDGVQTVSSGTFTITWDATNGVGKIAAA